VEKAVTKYFKDNIQKQIPDANNTLFASFFYSFREGESQKVITTYSGRFSMIFYIKTRPFLFISNPSIGDTKPYCGIIKEPISLDGITSH